MKKKWNKVTVAKTCECVDPHQICEVCNPEETKRLEKLLNTTKSEIHEMHAERDSLAAKLKKLRDNRAKKNRKAQPVKTEKNYMGKQTCQCEIYEVCMVCNPQQAKKMFEQRDRIAKNRAAKKRRAQTKGKAIIPTAQQVEVVAARPVKHTTEHDWRVLPLGEGQSPQNWWEHKLEVKAGQRLIAEVSIFAGDQANASSNDIREGEANGRLIARAPKLFKVCRDALAAILEEVNAHGMDGDEHPLITKHRRVADELEQALQGL